MWEVRAYRSNPLHYAGTEQRQYATQAEASNVAGALRRTDGYFCVEVRENRPAFFWLGAEAETASPTWPPPSPERTLNFVASNA